MSIPNTKAGDHRHFKVLLPLASTGCSGRIRAAKEGGLETPWSKWPPPRDGTHAAPELVAKGQTPQGGSGVLRLPRAAGKLPRDTEVTPV